MTECDDDIQVTEEVIEEQIFLTNIGANNKNENIKKTCTLKCGELHRNGSLYFCQQFRKKEPEERKAIQSKLHNLCILPRLEGCKAHLPYEVLLPLWSYA